MKDLKLLRNRIISSCLILGLLAATSAQAESYRSTVKRSMNERLEPLSAGIKKLDRGESICGIGIQGSWDRTVVHLSDVGTSNGLRSGDEVLAVNGEQSEEKPASYGELIQRFGADDKIIVNILRNEQKIDIEAVCVEDSERFRLQVDMLQYAAKGKWQQCIDSSYALESLDGKRTLFSADVRNTCTEAKRCGWKCRKPAIADATSLYEVNLSEIEAVELANIDIDGTNLVYQKISGGRIHNLVFLYRFIVTGRF